LKAIQIALVFSGFFITLGVSAQTSYRNELGGRITKTQFEEQILNMPYFGIPGEVEGEMVLVYRMPIGKVDNPELFYTNTGNKEAFIAGKSLIVFYYPGPDECNMNTSDFEVNAMDKADKSLRKWAEKGNAVEPVYIYKSSGGLERYSQIMQWEEDPEDIFEKQFFKFPYPCKSFVVIHPSGEFRSILGDFPLSQVDQALKKLNRANK
jgi:hypothetical protein